MRNHSSLFISGAVAAVAVAASPSAASVWPVQVDNFTAGAFSTQNAIPSGYPAWTAQTNASIFALPGSNNYRSVQAGTSITPIDPNAPATGSASFVSTANGSATVSISANLGTTGAIACAVNLAYGKPFNDTLSLPGSSVDITSYTALTMFGSGTYTGSGGNFGTGLKLYIQFMDNASAVHNTIIPVAAGAIGDFSLDLSTVTGINKAQVRAIQYQFYYDGVAFGAPSAVSASMTYNISGVQLVPAPGAVALLSAAGLVGTRRRRS